MGRISFKKIVLVMKKYLFLVVLIGLGVATLCSCGSSSSSKSKEAKEDIITVTSADGQEYTSYQEACAANDFEAAHRYLTKMENMKAEGYSNAKQYVFKKEALYLMSIGDDDAKKRIIYLLKEDENDKEIISMLIELAVVNDDAEFAITLVNQYNDGAIDNPSIISYFISKNSKHYSDIVLGNLPKITVTRPSLGTAIFYGSGVHTSDFESKCNRYIKEVSNFNNVISIILNAAIINKNQYVAKHAISKAKSNISVQDIGFVDNVHYHYKVNIDNSEAEELNKKYRDAIKSGAFN